MNLYKLCYRDESDHFYSFGGKNSDSALQYELNKWTFPNFGKIFVFDTLENVRLFKKPSHYFTLFECEVLGEPQYPNQICDWIYKSSYKYFWENKEDYYMVIPPRGTMIVDGVKLIKEVS